MIRNFMGFTDKDSHSAVITVRHPLSNQVLGNIWNETIPVVISKKEAELISRIHDTFSKVSGGSFLIR